MVEQNGSHNYLFSAKRRTGKEYMLTWTSSDRDEQDEMFEKLINAAFHYIIPDVMENLLDELKRGETLTIGPVQVTQHGMSFETTKWLFLTSQHQVPWSGVDVVLQNGSAIVVDKLRAKRSTPISLRDVPNAVMLRLFPMSFNRDQG
jgi:hypothetical protein